jgi:thiol-disulfide isomerase/thioredoxin
MDKRLVARVIVFVLFSAGIILIVLKISNRKAFAEHPKVLPEYNFLTIDKNPFEIDTVMTSSLIIVFYSPDCTFCEHEGADLSRNSKDFTDSKILFVTIECTDSASAYSKRFGIDTITNFYSLVDTSYQALLTFGIKAIPTTLIYDRDRRLVKVFEGEVNAKKILKTIRENE